jgi:hypothetical protein
LQQTVAKSDDGERSARQLALIGEFCGLAQAEGVECWLRGGWALDFFLGRVTRPHGDIDVFLWAADAPAFAAVLREHGFDLLEGPPPEQQLDFVKASEEFHVGLVRREASGAVVVAGGPHEGAPWPEGMLGDDVGRIGDVTCRIVSPEAMLEVKERWQEWTGRPARDYDAGDIALLRVALERKSG